MNSSMQHHCPGNGHDSSNSSLSNSILMMSRCASKPHHLFVVLEVVCKLLGNKGTTLISLIGLRHHTKVHAHPFKIFLGSESLMGVQMCLKLNMDQPCGCINKYGTSCVHAAGDTGPFGALGSPSAVADKVIKEYLLSRLQLILLEISPNITDFLSSTLGR